MKLLRPFLLSMISLCALAQVYAQASFTTRASASAIGKNDLLEVNYEVQNGNIDNFNPPSFHGWQVVGGPNVSSSTFISNGLKTVSMSYQYVLKPLHVGTYTLPGARAVVDGKTLTSNPVIVVVDNKTHPNNSSSTSQGGMPPLFDLPQRQAPPEDLADSYDGYILRDGENAEAKTKSNLFILINTSKKTCYEGEAIEADYQLYSRVNLNAHITKRPSFSGFSSIDLPDVSSSEFETVMHKGKQFRVYTIRKVQLYPLQAGTWVLDPVEIEANVQYKKVPGTSAMLNYDPFSPDNNVSFPYTVRSEAVSINVLPFPAAKKPADFTSVTGHYSIQAKLLQPQLALNQAGTLRIEVTGEGSWAMVQPPTVKWPQGVEAFEPTVAENLDSQKVPVAGSRIYEFPFSTGKPGKVTIPAVSISYFDPAKKEYITVATQPLQVEILNATLPAEQPDFRGDDYADATQVFTDIVKIAFPIIAIVLLLWLLVKYRFKKRYDRLHGRPWLHPGHPMDRIPNTGFYQHDESLRFTPPVSAVMVSPMQEETSVTAPSYSPPYEILPPAVETPVYTGPQFVSSREYFAGVKKELITLLQLHWKINEPTVVTTRKRLEEKGMMTEDAESISMLLEACDRHIYSPFAETIDAHEWNEILVEIKFILEKRKNA